MNKILLFGMIFLSTTYSLYSNAAEKFQVYNDYTANANGNLEDTVKNTQKNKENAGRPPSLITLDNQIKWPTALGLDNESTLHLDQTETFYGKKIEIYKTHYKGFPVVGSTLVVNYNAGKDNNISSVHGTLYKSLEEDLSTDKPPATLPLENIKNWVFEKYLTTDDKDDWLISDFQARTVVYVDKSAKANYSYEISFFADQHSVTNPVRPVIYLNPHNMQIIHQYDRLHFAVRVAGGGNGGNDKEGMKTYPVDGSIDASDNTPIKTFAVEKTSFIYRRDYCKFKTNNDRIETVNAKNTIDGDDIHKYDCEDNNIHEEPPEVHEKTGAFSPLNDAHYRAQLVQQMYRQWVGNGILGSRNIQQRVHYGENFDNAFWNGQYVAYGDGYLNFYPMVALDVVAHELTHAFTEKKSHLSSEGPDWAINESFSDIAGEAAEYFLYGSNDWIANYDSVLAPGKGLRYFADPTIDGKSIASVNDYTENMVGHYAAGIFNKAFYHLANSKGWNTKWGFKAFVAAQLSYCWHSNMGFEWAAQCVLNNVETIRSIIDCPDGDACKKTTVALQRDVRKAFSKVDLYPQARTTGVQAEFSLNTSFTTVSLVDRSYSRSSSVDTWHWDYGDGTTSDSPNPAPHQYQNPGTYEITLTVTDTRYNQNDEKYRDTFSVRVTVSDEYCQASANNSTKDWIVGVQYGEFNNTSGSSDYSDFSYLKIPLQKGNNIKLKLTPSDMSKNRYWYLWIDYNHDGDFNDDGEYVFSGSTVGVMTTDFSVPEALVASETRMRVIHNWAHYGKGPCGTPSHGEVEDYTIDFENSTVELNLSFAHSDLGNQTIQFINNSVAPAGTTWIWDFGDNSDPDNEKAPQHFYAEPGTYQVTLEATTSNGFTKKTPAQEVNVKQNTNGYCNASGGNKYERIASVKISNTTESLFENISDDSGTGYSDYTDSLLPLKIGSTYNIELKPWFYENGDEDVFWRVWIDFNSDKVFSDDELIVNEEILKPSQDIYSGTFKVSENVEPGNDDSRMRVIMRYSEPDGNDAPGACWEYTTSQTDGGEVEDYRVQLYN